MKRPVIAIGLDAAEPELLETWLSQGLLKNLKRLQAQGAYGRLVNFDYCRAETPWTTFLTGCGREKTGYWSPIKFHPTRYGITDVETYDFAEYPPFYSLDNSYRVAVFDTPHTTLPRQLNGLQVVAWGAHSPLAPSGSYPAPLFDDLVHQYGAHPTLHKDEAALWNQPKLTQLTEAFQVGIARRSAICRDLLQREPWDLFLTVFGESHSAGHCLWHLSQKDHPLYHPTNPDPLLTVFQAIDQAIGEIVADAPEGAYILIFSTHGMETNSMDLPGMVFLPELLYRFSFPNQYGLAKGEVGKPLPPPIWAKPNQHWLSELWRLKYDANPVKHFLRRCLPIKLFNSFEKALGWAVPPICYHDCEQLEFQPALWYQPIWPQMKAFALPSFSEGYIRVNLQGREQAGIVPEAEYDTCCEELTQHLSALRNPRTGKPLVKTVIRTRRSPSEQDAKLPDADLIVSWAEEPTDVVDSPSFGRIGPMPYYRAGSHTNRGFIIAQGPGIVPGSTLPEAHALDLPATILDLMRATIPDYFEGQPLPLFRPRSSCAEVATSPSSIYPS